MPKSSHPLLRSLGATIRARRRECGLSQESLADLADIDRSYMSSVERGLRNVSVLSLARIAGALNLPLWELLRPRRAPVAPQPDWRSAAFQPPPVSPTSAAEALTEYLPTCQSSTAASSAASKWEPRYLSLG